MNTYLEKQQSLDVLLEKARQEGEICIISKEGQLFTLKVLQQEDVKLSPLDVEGIDLGFSTDEIIDFIREGRK